MASRIVALAIFYPFVVTFYAAIVFPEATLKEVGDFAAYSATFEALSRYPLSSFSLEQVLSDDLLFYYAVLFFESSGDYESIFPALMGLNIFLYGVGLTVILIRAQNIWLALIMAIFLSLQPKVFELIFFNVRQGLATFLVFATFTIQLSLTRGAFIASALSLIHMSSLLLAIFFGVEKFLLRLKSREPWVILMVVSLLLSMVAAKSMLARLSVGWTQGIAYTAVAVLFAMASAISAWMARSNMLSVTALLLAVLVIGGAIMDFPSHRFIPILSLIYTIFIASKPRILIQDLIAVLCFAGLTFSSLGFWLLA